MLRSSLLQNQPCPKLMKTSRPIKHLQGVDLMMSWVIMQALHHDLLKTTYQSPCPFNPPMLPQSPLTVVWGLSWDRDGPLNPPYSPLTCCLSCEALYWRWEFCASGMEEYMGFWETSGRVPPLISPVKLLLPVALMLALSLLWTLAFTETRRLSSIGSCDMWGCGTLWNRASTCNNTPSYITMICSWKRN